MRPSPAFKLLFLFFPVLISPVAHAHPGTGIVSDSKGNIYYSDLSQVWKIEQNGRKSVVVPNVHTHELYMDASDQLFGEHLWYNGESLDTWGHLVWRYAHNKLDTVIPPSPGFLTGYSFVRDGQGNMYVIERGDTSRFYRITPGGKKELMAQRVFENIRWSYCNRDGTLYFVDLHRLYKLTKDRRFILLASNLDDGRTSISYNRQHNVYGIWDDAEGNVYVAVMAGKQIKRIKPGGQVEVVAYSTTPWSPTGGVFDQEGNLWVLENSLTNEVRVRKIAAKKLVSKPSAIMPFFFNFFLPVVLILGLVCLIFFVVKKQVKRKIYRL